MATLAAARRLFERNRNWALAIAGSALRRLGARADGDEIRQVAQVKTWDCALAFDPRRWTVAPAGDPFQLYAYPTVYGSCLMAGYRGQAGRAKSATGEYIAFAPVEAAEGIASGGDALDERLGRAAQRKAIADLLVDLPPRERHLIAEHYLAGASLTSIAVSMHRSPATAAAVHARALRLLREAATRRGMTLAAWL
jgi:RNA polymerase sigma factor (sigma-70 family)